MAVLNEENRSRLSALIAAGLIVIAGFLVYRNFSTVEEAAPGSDLAEETFEEGPTGPEGDGMVAGEETTLGVGGEAPSGYWEARDIGANTISGDSYTVESGDTLWEVAEGRYGSGFEWTKILDANNDQIGLLPSGQQALIVPGQTLNLPE